MPKTVEQIRQQIAKLQQQEQAILSKEVDGVVARIRAAIAYYNLTPERLFGEVPQSAPEAHKVKGKRSKTSLTAQPGTQPVAKGIARRASVPKGTKIAVKYKDEAGNTWTGRGSQPRWVRSAIEAGRKLEDFAVE